MPTAYTSPNGDEPHVSLFSEDYGPFDINAASQNTLADSIEERKSAITVSELAKIMQCSRGQVYKWIEQKRLPAIKIGTMVRLDPAEVADWIRGRVTTI